MSGFYAVRNGRNTGIYRSWKECEAQVKGFSKARYKKFGSRREAEAFMSGYDGGCCSYYAPVLQPTSNYYAPDHRPTSTYDCLHTRRKVYKRSNDFDDNEDFFVSKHYKESNLADPTPVVYSDGACHANGHKGAHGGVGVYWGDSHPYNVSEKLTGPQTNQRAELVAACRAIETAIQQGHKSVELRTDSNYTIRAATEWIKNWKSNGWKSTRGEDVKNKEDILRLDNLCSKINVKWTHIKGHSGIAGNDLADQLAKAGSLL